MQKSSSEASQFSETSMTPDMLMVGESMLPVADDLYGSMGDYGE